ncbi:MAG: biotin transporter BioY [Pseudomonadota bacterium]
MTVSATPTLASALWPTSQSAPATLFRPVVLAVAGAALITLCAKIQVPMWPVPMTMQVFAVLLVALAYGSRLGTATVALYLAQGAAGLPVFAQGGGIAYFFGPTGGFLLGFLAAAWVTGRLAERGFGRGAVPVFIAAVVGITTIYAIGVAWLAVFLMSAKGLAASTAIMAALSNGMVPFLAGDAVKALLAGLLVPSAWKLVGRG